MTTKKFIIKTIILLLFTIIFSICINGLFDTFNVIVSNNLAVGQLANDDFSFASMELYNRVIKPVATVLIYAIYACIILIQSMNIYKFIKNRKKDNKDEDC